MIPKHIIEKAAEAKFKREYPDDAFSWDDAPEHVQKYCRDAVVRVITPVYADIQAKAIREAANAYQVGGWAKAVPRGNDRPTLILGMAQHAINWFRARADELDGGKP